MIKYWCIPVKQTNKQIHVQCLGFKCVVRILNYIIIIFCDHEHIYKIKIVVLIMLQSFFFYSVKKSKSVIENSHHHTDNTNTNVCISL